MAKNRKLGDQQGGGQGEVNHLTSMSMTEGLAAWALANEKPAYAPLNSRDTVNSLSQVAQALNHELGFDFSPSPFGSSHPDLQRSVEPPPKIKDVIPNPNVAPFAYQSPQGVKQVVLELNQNNSYLVEGLINGQPVTFVVDTGASQVSIPKRIAAYLNLKPQGCPSHARTANGLVEVYSTHLATVTVGNIELPRVSAMLNLSDTSEHVLLGMSFLKRLSFQYREGKLILTQG